MTGVPADRPVALVTGASSGIGAAVARRLARDGFDVAISFAGNANGAEDSAAACRKAGAQTLVLQGDVAEAGACARFVTETMELWRRLDVVVSNAGVTKFADFRDLDALGAADFARIFAVNVTAAYELAKAAAPHLESSSHAAFVTITSHSGISGLGSSHAYAASKGALNTLTLGLARALAPAIRVNAVCPGYVDTPWHARRVPAPADLEAYKKGFADIAPLKRLTMPDDVAEAVSFFATGARAITGQILVVDGGTHLTIASPQSTTIQGDTA
jgi:3-oxoacyl-[acyl-carrier protein] reductase